MSIPYVCSACRLASLTRSIRATQQHIRTLSQSATRKQEAQRFASNGRQEDGSIGGGSNGGIRGRYSGRELRPEQLLTQLDRPGPPPPRQRGPPRRTPHTDRPTRQNRYQPDEPTTKHLFAVPLNAQKLADELSKHSAAEDWPAAWRVLQELAKAYSTGNPSHAARFLNISGVSNHVAILLRRSVESLMSSVRSGTVDPAMPTPYQILLLLHNAYASKALYFRPLIWRLAEYLCNHRVNSARRAGQYDEHLPRGVDELVGIWRLCIGGNLSSKSLGGDRDAKARAFASVATEEEDWSFLPATTVFSSWHDRNSSTVFEEMLALLVPEAATKQDAPARSDYASAALITLDLLKMTLVPNKDGQIVPMATLPRYAPLAGLLEAMLEVASAIRVPPLLNTKLSGERELHRSELQAMLARLGFKGFSTDAVSIANATRPGPKTTDSAKRKVADAASALISGKVEKPSQEAKATEMPAVERYTEKQIGRLVKAMQGKDVAQIPRIVREVHIHAATRSDGETLPVDLYEHMLLASLSLKDTKTAVEVWQNMTQLGIEPTIKTYTVMMRGSQNARDVKGMEAFFHRMRQAGLQPDAYSWSIRIFGLLKLRSVSTGMKALDEMGQEWFAAAKAKAILEGTAADKKQLASNKHLAAELMRRYPGSIDGVPRPTLEIMNAAMSALATARPEEVPKVFSWGRSFGIEPDLSTFNTLISISMKNRPEDALVVLRQMQERGIEADTTTWTVLLTSLFEGGFLDNLSHAAQQTKIITFIDALSDKSNNLPGINSMGYALIIDRLLKHYQNDSAAAAVYSHMLSHNHKPTPHIYTILMTSYFARQPQPDFSAIENLWRQIQDNHQQQIDTIFYDRMIEGYAQNHHLVGIRPMETFLNRCRDSGKKPGWKALENVARVYAERQMWQKMRTLVDEARIAMRDQTGRLSKHGEREFWDYVHSTGLLREEGYVTRQDFKKDRPVGSPLERAERGRGGV